MGERGKQILYMVVTNDEFELPVFLADSAREVADFLEIKVSGLYCNVSNGNVAIGKGRRKYKLVRFRKVPRKEEDTK